MQGNYEKLMSIVLEAQEVCLEAGSEELVVTLKVHARKNGDVTWEEKLEKYS